MRGTTIHGLATAIAQVAVWLVTGDPWLGGLLGVAFWSGNEFAQAEYRAIGSGRRQDIRLFTGLNPKHWTAKSVADVIAPALVAMSLGFVL